MTPKVAIIGRPNVGKSTLFNRLVGKRLAIVDDTPGVTRDRREVDAALSGKQFTFIDTAGLESSKGSTLESRMRAQTDVAIEQADIILFMIDAREGLTPLDEHFASEVRKSKKQVILLANKSENQASIPGALEAYALGLGEPLAISAEHGNGIGELHTLLHQYADDEPEEEEDDADQPIQLAIVGRPNAGKSTLFNALLGEDRVLTGPEAGITRDAIAVPFEYKGQNFKLIDTAGMRRKARVTQKVEKLSVGNTNTAIQYAHVVVLMVDAIEGLEKQDLTIAQHIVEEGRILILAINKWDAIKEKAEFRDMLEYRLDISLPQVKGLPVVMMSALKGKNIEKILDEALSCYELWNHRISTAKLNQWLEHILAHHPPPLVKGRRIKLRYMTQAKTRPPTFAVFANKPQDVPAAYQKYLVNSLRKDFELPGIPLRLVFRGGKNPYATK